LALAAPLATAVIVSDAGRASAAATESVLYSFCKTGNCPDGKNPAATLVSDKQGNLYGVTSTGGIACSFNAGGCGVLFKITPAGAYTILHQFQGKDGANPNGALIIDGNGDLFGTAAWGGAYGQGVVFKRSATGVYSVLYSFCKLGGGCPDGCLPGAGLYEDHSGNLCGTASQDGAGAGTIFRLSSTTGAYKVLYSFGGGLDGATPRLLAELSG